jgi:hypothetical protein
MHTQTRHQPSRLQLGAAGGALQPHARRAHASAMPLPHNHRHRASSRAQRPYGYRRTMVQQGAASTTPSFSTAHPASARRTQYTTALPGTTAEPAAVSQVSTRVTHTDQCVRLQPALVRQLPRCHARRNASAPRHCCAWRAAARARARVRLPAAQLLLRTPSCPAGSRPGSQTQTAHPAHVIGQRRPWRWWVL